jgi:lysophospholipase L1-like esterase
MIYKNVELHNVEEVIEKDDGILLQRIPEYVRKELNETAQMRYLQPNNCEIRFICDSPDVSVTLSSEGKNNAILFFGCFDGIQRYEITQEPVSISLSRPERVKERLQKLEQKYRKNLPFSSDVYRIILGNHKPGSKPVILHEIQGDNIRPPKADELPPFKYLAYGTSITHGNYSSTPQLCYAAQAAWHLGADLINLGTGGSCYCEPAIADYIAGRTDWDIATLCLSVNMIQHDFSLEEFETRVSYMVNKVAGADIGRPVVCITPYPYFRDFGTFEPPTGKKWLHKPEKYRQLLRDIIKKCPYPNVYLLEGPELLGNLGGLSCDLLHPADNGMIEIGRNLAEKLKILLESII